MGRHAGLSHSTVQRIWSKNGLKPHVVRTFKLSNDPNSRKSSGRDRALSRSAGQGAGVMLDEKSQCQALERTQLGLPLAPRRPAR